MTDNYRSCAHFSDSLAELALGVLNGRERGDVLVHLQDCPRCTAKLEGLSMAVDGLLEVVPGVDPPLGFEVRVLDRLELGKQPRQRLARKPLLLGLALACLLALGGIGLGWHAASSAPPRSQHAAIEVGPITATLLAKQGPRGEVLLYRGHPGWFVMVVNGMKGVTRVRCLVTTSTGPSITIGWFSLNHGSGTWSGTLPVAADSVRSAAIASPGGTVLGSAILES